MKGHATLCAQSSPNTAANLAQSLPGFSCNHRDLGHTLLCKEYHSTQVKYAKKGARGAFFAQSRLTSVQYADLLLGLDECEPLGRSPAGFRIAARLVER